VASDREYKKTSRGIDVITTYLAEKGHTVDHLVFFRRRQIAEKQVTKQIRQLYFYDNRRWYYAKLRNVLPGFFLRWYFKTLIAGQGAIDFSAYDVVILESGLPVYISLVLKNRILYRQSDPVEISFNSNRRFYRKLEEELIQKALFVSSALKEEFYPAAYKDKFYYWHSGFIPAGIPASSAGQKHFVFAGGGELDWVLIARIAKKYPEYLFHIVGLFKKKRIPANVIIHGYLEHEAYRKIVADASVFIIPFSARFAYQLRRCYFTAKVLMPIQMGIPVLLKSYGAIQHSDMSKKLFVYHTRQEAVALLEDILSQISGGRLPREVTKEAEDFLRPQMLENRLKELDGTFGKWVH
jgi:hypothetical protein